MVDITIYGAGIFGLSTAFACLQQGARVRVIDPAGPGAGASGGLVGALAPHVPENWNAKKAFQFESLIKAESFWRDVQKRSGRDPGYARLGRIQPIADERLLQLARERAENARTLWQGQAQWQVRPARELGDWCPLSPSGWVVHDTLSARLHPRLACTALATAIREMGGEIMTAGPETGRVLWATGIADLEKISAQRPRIFGAGVKGQAALLKLNRSDAPQLFADSIHIIPHVDGTVAIGSTSERDYETPPTVTPLLEDVLERARKAAPALRHAEVIERWAGIRPRSRSRAPVLGKHPLNPDHFIANGGFKIGFGMAPKIAETMCALLVHDKDTIPDDFRPELSL